MQVQVLFAAVGNRLLATSSRPTFNYLSLLCYFNRLSAGAAYIHLIITIFSTAFQTW